MPRRALLATIITAAAGALLGVVLGGLVGRVIALFGDETVQTSVPMVFCATLGFFVGGASTIKGSLERFGAPRATVATVVAALVLVLLVGGVSVTAKSGVVVVVTALVALVLASVAAVAVGQPEAAPRHSLNAPRTPNAPRTTKEPKAPKAPKADVVADAEPEDAPEQAVGADPSPERPSASDAARRVDPTRALRPKPRVTPLEQLEDWVPEDESASDPPAEADVSPALPRRDRPLGSADVPTPTPVAKKAAPAKKASPPKKKAAKKATPAIKKPPASNKARGAAKKSR